MTDASSWGQIGTPIEVLSLSIKRRGPVAYTPVTLSDETKSALDSEFDDILVMRGGARAPWLVVLRRPKRQETIGYKAHAKRDPTTANEQLIRKIACYPKDNDFEKQLERWPFLCDGIADSEAFKDFLGLTVSEDLKE